MVCFVLSILDYIDEAVAYQHFLLAANRILAVAIQFTEFLIIAIFVHRIELAVRAAIDSHGSLAFAYRHGCLDELMPCIRLIVVVFMTVLYAFPPVIAIICFDIHPFVADLKTGLVFGIACRNGSIRTARSIYIAGLDIGEIVCLVGFRCTLGA